MEIFSNTGVYDVDMNSFVDLDVWKKGLDLVDEVYKLTKSFPKQEIYALTSQIQKSSTSILANIAEGFSRYTYPDKANKYAIARGECSETKAFLLIAVRLKFVTAQEARHAIQQCEEIGRMISGLITFCKERS